jgi:glycine oxidase
VPAPPQLPESTGIVVVGGGIIGLSIAWEARRRGHQVVLVDKLRCGGGATPVAAGMLAPVSEADPSLPAMIELGLESCRLYPDFVAGIERQTGLDCGYRREGTLAIALHRDHREQLEHRARAHQELGLKAERLSGREVLKLEPALSPRVVGGLRTEIDRQVDPRLLATALRRAAEDGGATIVEGAELAALHHDDGGSLVAVTLRGAAEGSPDAAGAPDAVTGEPADGTSRTPDPSGVGAGTVAGGGVAETRPTTGFWERTLRVSSAILCAGVWTRDLLPELAALTLHPVKGQVLRLHGDMPINHVIATPDVYMVPRRSGELVIGASAEEQGFDERPTAGVAMDLLVHAWRALPSIYELEIREINVGLRPALRDHMPAIGALDLPGVFVATGHYRNGIMLAPVTAKHLVDAIESGEVPAALAPFDPLRFGKLAGAAAATGAGTGERR